MVVCISDGVRSGCRFEVNFGQREPRFTPPMPGFVFIDHMPLQSRVRGMIAPPRKADCEVIIAGSLDVSICGKSCIANPTFMYMALGVLVPPFWNFFPEIPEMSRNSAKVEEKAQSQAKVRELV